MQLPALGLAASLLLGPAPAHASLAPSASTSVAPDSEADAPTALPDVDEPAEPAEAEPAAPEPAPEPEPPAPAEPAPEPEPEPPAPEIADPTASATASPAVTRDRLGCAGSKSCRKMTVAGIVIGTLGVAAVGTGIGLIVQPDEVIPERPIYVTSTRPAGLVALTLGAGVTLTAVLMLVAAHKGYKQRGAQARRVEPLANGLRF